MLEDTNSLGAAQLLIIVIIVMTVERDDSSYKLYVHEYVI